MPSSIIYHKVGLTRNGNINFNKAFLGYLSQFFFIRTTKNKASWVGWFIIYGFYLAFLLPIRTIITNGFNGSLSTYKAALSAWLMAWRAERAWPAGDKKGR
jgi:GT2 family glycosyltransferase